MFTTTFAVVVLSVVLVLANLFKKLLVELDKYPDLGFGFVAEFILNVMPFSLIFTIPWGLLTAILLTFGRISADNELTALRMSGLSMPRICAPVFGFAIFLTGVTLWMNVDQSPRSQFRINQLFFELATENPGAIFVKDEVVDTLPGYVIYVEDRELINAENNDYHLKNLQLIKLNDRKRPEVFIRAKEAYIGFEPGNRDDLFMNLVDYHIEHSADTDGKRFLESTFVKAENGTIQVSLGELRDRHRKDRPSFMTIPELRQEMANTKSEMEAPERKPQEKKQLEKRLSSLKTEINKRFSLSLACLTLCLVGIPLGVTAQRRETSVGFALSLIIAIAYFLFIIVAEIFNENADAYPHLLIWLPNVVFMGLGLALFSRLSRK